MAQRAIPAHIKELSAIPILWTRGAALARRVAPSSYNAGQNGENGRAPRAEYEDRMFIAPAPEKVLYDNYVAAHVSKPQADHSCAGQVMRDDSAEARAFDAYLNLAEQPSEAATIRLYTDKTQARGRRLARAAEEWRSSAVAWTKRRSLFIYRATREPTRVFY
jgi:hypothetical protein